MGCKDILLTGRTRGVESDILYYRDMDSRDCVHTRHELYRWFTDWMWTGEIGTNCIWAGEMVHRELHMGILDMVY